MSKKDKKSWFHNMGFRFMNSFAPAVRRTQMKFRLTEGAASAKELPCPYGGIRVTIAYQNDAR